MRYLFLSIRIEFKIGVGREPVFMNDVTDELLIKYLESRETQNERVVILSVHDISKEEYDLLKERFDNE